jgi:hypothetical protein
MVDACRKLHPKNKNNVVNLTMGTMIQTPPSLANKNVNRCIFFSELAQKISATVGYLARRNASTFTPNTLQRGIFPSHAARGN